VKYIFLCLVSAFFFSLTYASAPTEFTGFDFGFLGLWSAIVFGIQILIARKLEKHQAVQNLILAVFATTNILGLNLVLNEAFLNLPVFGQWLSLLLALFILFTFMNMLDENARIAKALPALFSLATAGVLLQTLLSVPTVAEVSIEPGKTSAKNIRLVGFKTKPNVYFISFDSIVPKVLLQKHLDLETTPYHEVFDANFRHFRNFFADRIFTKASLNSLLALDIGHFSEAAQNNTESYFFTGLIPSPLFEIFKHTGYETNTLYIRRFLGPKKGKYVDNYWANTSDLKRGACEFLNTDGFKVLSLMGYCYIVKDLKVSWRKPEKQSDFLIRHMRAGLQKYNPQIFVAYIYSPGHTLSTFKRSNEDSFDRYRERYLRRSKSTAKVVEEIVSFIDKEDPEALVYVFGDHGPFLSRGYKIEEDTTFIVQDRYGVYGGIYPRDRCADSFATAHNEDFMTILKGTHMIIRCLSGGENAFLVAEEYRLPRPLKKKNNRYEDYLYE
jgi:hypothetical protein